ncbi:MAG: hypothetical protein RL211_2124 [Pseudomonadota bacterium]|jgi:predicted Zn finger-like uncharacterized protein
MSLITRCPACETLFKVVPDQLRISDGWVRCGQCEEIFDASSRLLPEGFAATVFLANPLVDSTQKSVNAVSNRHNVSPGADPEGLPSQTLEVLNSPDDSGLSWQAESILPAPDDSYKTNAKAKGSDRLGEAGEVLLVKELKEIVARRSQHAPLNELVKQSDQVTDSRRVTVAIEDEPDFEPVEPSFVQGMSALSDWQKSLIRSGLQALVLVLLGVLSVQVTLHERNRIAALAPTLQPLVSTICKVANCTVSPVQQIESIVIESSSFAKIRGDVYRFDFVIRSIAGMALATPAVELSLTDPQNRTVIRRVFLPAEFGAHPDVLVPGAEWSGSLVIGVSLSADVERISGYRVLAFYP